MHLARFGTDQACHDYLIAVGWNGKPECPKCGNNSMNYYISTRKVYKCSDCYKQFSVIQGTIFERSKIPLSTWFLCIYLFTTKKRGVSSIQMGKWLGVKQHTAWFMLHRLREAVKDENEIVLSGEIEADELFITPKVRRDRRLMWAKELYDQFQSQAFGLSQKRRLAAGDKQKRGRKKGSTKEVLKQKEVERGGSPYASYKPSELVPFEQGAVILGLFEKGTGKVVLKKLGPDSRFVNHKSIYPLLRKHIMSGSSLYTDEAPVYKSADKLFPIHYTVNHQKTFVDDGVHTNNIENTWNHFRRVISGTYYHMSYHHFDGYLNENTYRWNRREESDMFLFENFIPLLTGKRIEYNQLKNKRVTRTAA